MARALRHHRFAAGLAVILPFATFLPAACGGSDTIPYDDDAATTPDAPRADTSTDTSLSDTSNDTSTDTSSDTTADTRTNDSSSDARLDTSETSLADTSTDTSLPDTSLPDTSVPDASVLDAADAADSADARDAKDSSVVLADPRLGSVAKFAVFAGSTVTNKFATLTTITGDLGTYPDTTAIGATPPVLIGAYHLGDGVAAIAANDLIIAYDNLTPAKKPGCTVLTGQDLGGKTLPPGIYCFATSAQLTGALVLDAGTNPNPEWFFQIGSTLTTGPVGATPASVTVIGANPCRVYWQVGSSATLGTGTSFSGTILAAASITLVTGTTLKGRALAVNAAVTMDTNTVSLTSCQ